jgi:hypothetical protein
MPVASLASASKHHAAAIKATKARTVFDRIGAGHCRVVKPLHDVEPRLLGEPLDRDPLSALRVFILADVGGRRCTHIADGLNQIPLSPHGLSPNCNPAFGVENSRVSQGVAGTIRCRGRRHQPPNGRCASRVIC